jgi:hypothetical protein
VIGIDELEMLPECRDPQLIEAARDAAEEEVRRLVRQFGLDLRRIVADLDYCARSAPKPAEQLC